MLIDSYLKDKVVLVTGGTGSFGQAFIKEVLANHQAKKVIVFSRDEFKQHQMKQSLEDNRLRFFIGDVRDKDRLERAFTGVDIVIHAAALKQVPTLEYNPSEAIKTNILGTQNVIDAAIDRNVKKVIFISTDKAVYPVNLYGATKLAAEKIIIASNAYSPDRTLFSVVRYGNVVGSRGSIIETLIKQKENKVVTLTDNRMTRFWLPIEQGVALVLKSLEIMYGGEIFIPKIPSMKVVDLITYLAPKAEIKIIGIRPGEKLHEMLITEEEARYLKEFDNFFIIEPYFEWWPKGSHSSGKNLKKTFRYTSDTNKQWLTPKKLELLLKEIRLAS